MSWGIAETAPEKEKIKAEYADRLNGYNSCGRIDYDVYSDLFDDGMELLDKMYEQGKKDAERTGHWIVETDCEGKTRTVICEDCGYESGPYQWKNPKFCPDCGRRMIKKGGETHE